jgi:uncharacterized protein (TIGR02594 family)
MVREEIAARTSVFNLVRIATGSTLLATILQSKYGKRTPIEREEDKERNKQAEQDKRFKMFTASSIANLSKRISLAEEITKRNTAMILNLYNDIGYSRIRKRMSPVNIKNLSSVRVPISSRTVVGEIDQLKKQIEQLDKLKKVKPKLQTSTEKKKKEKQEKLENSSGTGLLSIALGNPKILSLLTTRLVPLVGGVIATALSVNSGAPKRVIQRLRGQDVTWINPGTGKEEKMPDYLQEITSKTDPYVTGVGAVGAAASVFGAIGAAKAIYGVGKRVMNRFRAPAASATPTTPASTSRAGVVSQFAGLNKRQLTTGDTGDKVAAMLNTSKNQLQKMSVRQIKAALRTVAPPTAGIVSRKTSAPAAAAAAPVISSEVVDRVKTATEQSVYFQKFSEVLLKLAKPLGVAKVGLLTLEISKMASFLADYGAGKISYADYKKYMSESYAEMVKNVGIITVSAALGAAGGAAVSIYAGGLGAIPGAVIGLGAGIAVNYLVDDDSYLPVGTFIFEAIHEGKSPPTASTTPTSTTPDTSGNRLTTSGAPSTRTTTSAQSAATSGQPNAANPPPISSGTVGSGEDIVKIAATGVGLSEQDDAARVREFLAQGGIAVTDPATEAWCASYVNSVLSRAGYKGKTKVANSFQAWGAPVSAFSQVKAGDVVIQTRGLTASSPGGHVGIATGRYVNGRIEMIAGNTGRAGAGVVKQYFVPTTDVVVRRATDREKLLNLVGNTTQQSRVAALTNDTATGAAAIASLATSSVALAPPAAEATAVSSETNAELEDRVEDAQITAHSAAIATRQLASASAALQAGINETRTLAMDNEFPSVLNPQHDLFSRYSQMANRLV